MPSAEYLKSLFGLDGLTAVVVGGTGTLGGAFCDALAGAGAFVYVVGRDESHGAERVSAIRQAGGAAEFFRLDATKRSDYLALRDRMQAAGQRCDVLINGAGINAATPFLEIPDDEWERIFAVNVTSVRLGCQVFGEMMLAQESGGSIINIASVSSEIPLSRVYTYSASKAAVVSLTRNLAREWGPKQVRVNALSPGFFPAEQNRKLLFQADGSPTARTQAIWGHTPMKRFGTPEELIGAVVFLASPKASSFVTGTDLAVDGGFLAQTI